MTDEQITPIPHNREMIITVEQDQEIEISLEKGDFSPADPLPDLLLIYEIAKA